MPNGTARASCPVLELRSGSTLIPKVLVLIYRFQGFRRKHGWRETFRKIWKLLIRRHSTGSREEVARSIPLGDAALELKAGEWVEVKSYQEICETLDENQRHRGMLFMPEMAAYCGKKLQVHKVVKRMLVEDTREVRRLRNTVLLTGSTCSGLSVGCDRCCFHFWREAWLRRVDDASQDT